MLNHTNSSPPLPNDGRGGQIPEYAAMTAFAKAHKGITYERFDSHLVRDLNLFAIKEDLDFEKLEETLDRMIKELPTLKRILAKPIIRLTDSEEVLPVEAVRLINNRTLVHASVHSEMWQSTEGEGLKPRKLLTLQHKDQYAFYENLVVVRAVDLILAYVGNHIRILNDLLYTDRNMQFNLLERNNHLSYFLAVGKLHVGYVRDYDQYRVQAERCLEKLLYLDRILRARLGCKLYRECHKINVPLTLQRTNIFRMQKDYHRIYLLMRWFEENDVARMATSKERQLPSDEGYLIFCAMLSLFAIGHFNFVFDADEQLDLEALCQHARYLGWTLEIGHKQCEGKSFLMLNVKKDESYRVLLYPSTDAEKGQKEIEVLKDQIGADEYLLLTPERTVGMASLKSIPVSLYDVESFRRIQQILLRAMICADHQKEDCPFCGGSMVIDSDVGRNGYRCPLCRTQIFQKSCADTSTSFVATGIYNYKIPSYTDNRLGRADRLLKERQTEALLHFRNVTPIDEEGRVICPSCGKRHL